ncbi:MAG: DUF72 domain-containing protein [Actinomycetota bacterium]
MTRGRALVGTSGFAYADWRPRFYPEGLAQSKFLAHYASRLRSVEINYTFNRFPTESLLSGWAGKVPPEFSFALKLPRRITHERRLRDCGVDLARFAAPAATLGRRLGPLLAQTPPTLPADKDVLQNFVAAVPPGMRVAMEFRHPSWDDDAVREILREAGIAWAIVEDEDREAAVHQTGTGFAYARLRRPAYDDEHLSRWREALNGLLDEGLDVYCYLRHDAGGSNALAAESLASRLALGLGSSQEDEPGGL